jgi:hypothetical protein
LTLGFAGIANPPTMKNQPQTEGTPLIAGHEFVEFHLYFDRIMFRGQT